MNYPSVSSGDDFSVDSDGPWYSSLAGPAVQGSFFCGALNSMGLDKRAIRGPYVNPGEEAERTPQGGAWGTRDGRAAGLVSLYLGSVRTGGRTGALTAVISVLLTSAPALLIWLIQLIQSRVRVAVSWQQQSLQIESLSSRDHENR